MIFVWVALYGVANAIVSGMVYRFRWAAWVVPIMYGGLFLLWIFRTGKQIAVGLMPLKKWGKDSLRWIFPLVVFPGYNILTGSAQIPEIAFLIKMLYVAFVEELFFRGFLLSYLRKWGVVPAVFLTSLVFALMHGINFMGNRDVLYICFQILGSFFVSICYCTTTVYFGSILPCTAAHFLTNITGSGAIKESGAVLWLLGCFFFYLVCGLLQLRYISGSCRSV